MQKPVRVPGCACRQTAPGSTRRVWGPSAPGVCVVPEVVVLQFYLVLNLVDQHLGQHDAHQLRRSENPLLLK